MKKTTTDIHPNKNKTFLWKAKDKRKYRYYKWEILCNTEGREQENK